MSIRLYSSVILVWFCTQLSRSQSYNWNDETSLISRWFSPNEVSHFLQIAKPGDRIEFYRGRYNHWAIFVGGEFYESGGHTHFAPFVIHAGSPNGSNSKYVSFCSSKNPEHGLGVITLDQLNNVIHGSLIRINNNLDAMWKPFSPTAKVVSRARQEYEKHDRTYNALANNCEHFVNWCRYGQNRSFQVESWYDYFVGFY